MESTNKLIRPKFRRTDSIANYTYVNNYCKKRKLNNSINKNVKVVKKYKKL